jgi:hypothetical protein
MLLVQLHNNNRPVNKILVGCTTGVRSGTGAWIFHSATASKSALRSIRPPGQWEPGLFARVQRPERETDHSSASNAGVECVELHLHSPIRLHVYFRTGEIYLSNKIIKKIIMALFPFSCQKMPSTPCAWYLFSVGYVLSFCGCDIRTGNLWSQVGTMHS